MTGVLIAIALLPLAAVPLPAWLQRVAGIDPALTALVVLLGSCAAALLMLPAALAGTASTVAGSWVPALGIGVALRADRLAIGFVVAAALAASAAVAFARLDPRRRPPPGRYGLALALNGTIALAALAADLALFWASLELATLASLFALAADGGPGGRRATLAVLVALEAGGLALLAAALLVADAAGGFRLDDALRIGAELHTHPLYVLMMGLLLVAAVTRLAPAFAGDGRSSVTFAVGAGVATALLVVLRFAPLFGGTRAWSLLLAIAAASAALLVAGRWWRSRSPARGNGPAPLDELALAARLVWRPLAAPRPALSLAALATLAGFAVAVGGSGVRPGAWPGPAGWLAVAGSAWPLLAAAAVGAGARLGLSRALVASAAGAWLLLAVAVSPAIAAAELCAGVPALWLLTQSAGVPRPARGTWLALGTALVLAVAFGATGPARGYLVPGAAIREWVVLAPVVLPLAAAAVLAMLRVVAPSLERALAGVALVANLALAAALLVVADRGVPLGFALGDWPTPLGVHLLLDRLSASLLVVAALVVALAHGHALGAEEPGRRGHVQLQLLLAGAAGCVLAADLLELCVYSGLLLLAVDRLLASATPGARAHVAIVGAAGAGVQLVAVGCIYAALGTLGLAPLALAAPAVANSEAPLLHLGAYLLLVAFALRAAAQPLGWWLTRACAEAPAAVAAVLVVAAEIGVYGVLRLYALVFPCFGAGPCGPSGLVLPLGLATLAAGGIAALAADGRRGLRAPLLSVALGMLLVGTGSFREAGTAAAIFGLAPVALAAVAFAFAAELDGRLGRALGIATLAAALGWPPAAGWIARIALLGAAAPDAPSVWPLVGATLLLAALAAAREALSPVPETAAPLRWPRAQATAAALALLVALAVAAGPAYELARRTARQLYDRRAYVAAVLGADATAQAR